MKKKELAKRIEALEAQVAALQAAQPQPLPFPGYRTYDVPAWWQTQPYCDTTTSVNSMPVPLVRTRM